MSESNNPQQNARGNGEKHITIDEQGDVQLPVVELLTGRGFITGKSGSGKSNSASVVAEELLSDGYPLLIVDTDGEYYGLKEEYEMLHVGADEECDLQVGPEHGEKLAELALEQNVPIILDVSGFLDEDVANDLIRETAQSLFTKEKKLKRPFLMLIEEVHEYIPEGGGLNDVGQMLVKVGKRGRKHGLGLVGISQRPADVKKDFITQANWMLWHRLTWDNDTKVVRRVVDKGTANTVQDLDDGEAFLMADWSGEDIQRVQVRRKHTFDAGATPDLGEFERPELKSVSGDLVDELEEISKQQSRRQDRISQLEQRIETLEEEKAELEDQLEAERQNNETVEKLADKLTSVATGGENGSEALDEIREEKNEEIRDLERTVEKREARIEDLEAELGDAREELQNRPDIDERAVEAVEVLADEFGVGSEDTQKLRAKLKSARERINELEEEQSAPEVNTDILENTMVERFMKEMQRRIDDLGEKEREMLRYYIIEGPAGMDEAYKYAGGSPTSGAKSKKTRTLRDAGLVRKMGRGEYGYGLREHVETSLGDSFTDDEMETVFQKLDDAVSEAVMAE